LRHHNCFIQPLRRGRLSGPPRAVLPRMMHVLSFQSVTKSGDVPQRDFNADDG
jgi:hypothetical protein